MLLQAQSSPRKRKRSPIGSAVSAKIQRVGNGGDFDDEADDLDFLGTAALEDYELTQRESTSPTSTPVLGSNPVTLIPIPLSLSIAAKGKAMVKVMETPVLVKHKGSSSSAVSYEEHNVPHHDTPKLHSTQLPHQATASGTGDEVKDKIKHLQELNFSKDGEVKVLRGEKERLIGELRKKEEQMKQMQAALLSEKQAREKQLAKERDSLRTKLQFKEQEVFTLHAQLEQKSQFAGRSISPSVNSSRGPPQKASSILTTKGKAHAHHVAPRDTKQQTEFLSTETFMPLSQLNFDGGSLGSGSVTPVHVGSRHAPASKDEQVSRVDGKPKKVARSRSISPSPSDLKKMKKRSASDKGDMRESETPESTKSGCSSTTDQGLGSGDKHLQEEDETPQCLSVPGRELDGAQILLLLVKQNLLRPPFHLKSMEPTLPQGSISASTLSSVSSIDSQSSCEDERVTGLLSLLHVESKSVAPSFPSFVEHSTPSSDRWVYLQRHPSTSDSEQSCAYTPTRHAHPIPLRPHTLARTNLAQSRIRRNPSLLTTNKKSHSTANTPAKTHLLPDSTSSSLLSSVNVKSLHKSIGNLLASSEISRFASFSHQGKGSLLGSLTTISQPSCDSCDSIVGILKQVGQVISNYHRDQTNKARGTINTSSHFSLDTGESTDSSLNFSPKSSSAGSKMSTDLTSPLAGDQLFVSRALKILEVLVVYNCTVREQILLRPPEFLIDSQSRSSLSYHENSPSLNTSFEGKVVGREGVGKGEREGNMMSKLVEVSHRLVKLQEQDSPISETGLHAVST